MDPAPAKESLCARKQNFVFQGLLRITITTTATVTATVTVTVIIIFTVTLSLGAFVIFFVFSRFLR